MSESVIMEKRNVICGRNMYPYELDFWKIIRYPKAEPASYRFIMGGIDLHCRKEALRKFANDILNAVAELEVDD